jgi:hypothetical protein
MDDLKSEAPRGETGASKNKLSEVNYTTEDIIDLFGEGKRNFIAATWCAGSVVRHG